MERLPGNPMIYPAMMPPEIGENINGPSLIRVPSWVASPLGKYYLYFAHHKGEYIRMAYADNLDGPWKIYEPGTLQLSESGASGHIASPDVIVDEAHRQIRMYFHGDFPPDGQASALAVSNDGLHFTSYREQLGTQYFRVFSWNDEFYALSRFTKIFRSLDGITGWESGHSIYDPGARHKAAKVYKDRGVLLIATSLVGDTPEHLVWTTMDLSLSWTKWQAGLWNFLLTPENVWEGSDLPILPSSSGEATERVHELRDPAFFEDTDGTLYLIYSIAGEQGVGIAKLFVEFEVP